ncbi:MAG: hypothetical protein V4520_18495 [Bacteroidota bacterium]
MEKYYTAEQLEILRLNQHLRGKMSDDEILQLGEDLANEQDFEDGATSETLDWVSKDEPLSNDD